LLHSFSFVKLAETELAIDGILQIISPPFHFFLVQGFETAAFPMEIFQSLVFLASRLLSFLM